MRIPQVFIDVDLQLEKLVANIFKPADLNEVADKMHKRQLRGRWVCAFD